MVDDSNELSLVISSRFLTNITQLFRRYKYPFKTAEIERNCKMGGWRLEVGRMALYITFPVALFHYFNQPEFFEEWVVKTKRELYPPENTPEQRELLEAIQRLKAKQESDRLRLLEKSSGN